MARQWQDQGKALRLTASNSAALMSCKTGEHSKHIQPSVNLANPCLPGPHNDHDPSITQTDTDTNTKTQTHTNKHSNINTHTHTPTTTHLERRGAVRRADVADRAARAMNTEPKRWSVPSNLPTSHLFGCASGM